MILGPFLFIFGTFFGTEPKTQKSSQESRLQLESTIESTQMTTLVLGWPGAHAAAPYRMCNKMINPTDRVADL